MSHQTAVWLMHLSHGGNVVLLPPIVVLGVAMYAAGKALARAREAGDLGALRVAVTARWASFSLILGTVLFLAFTLVHPGCAVLVGEEMGCRSNVTQLGLALLMYAQDNNECYPSSGQWSEAITQYVSQSHDTSGRGEKDPFHCRAASTPWSYGMNAALGGVSLDKMQMPADTVILFEADARTRSFAGGMKDVAATRHTGMSNVGFSDGHAKAAQPARLSSFEWTLPAVGTAWGTKP